MRSDPISGQGSSGGREPPSDGDDHDGGVDGFFARFPQLPAPRGRQKILRGGQFADQFAIERALADAQARTDGLEQQYQEQLSQGHDEGIAAGRREAAHEFANHLNRIERQVGDFYQSAETTIAELGMRVAETIIGPIDSHEKAYLAARRAIEQQLSRQPYAVHVAPDTEAMITNALAEVQADYPDTRLPSVKIDKRLAAGRAVLITRHGSVDLDLQSQIAALRASLKMTYAPKVVRRVQPAANAAE